MTSAMQKGLVVAFILAVLTVAEYVFATHVTQTETQFIGLALTAVATRGVGRRGMDFLLALTIDASVAKAALFCYYFMHIYRLWRAEEAH